MEDGLKRNLRVSPSTQGNTGSIIGCDYACYAEVTVDDGNAVTYGTIYRLPGVKEISITPGSETATNYYDDGAGAVATSMGGIEVGFNKAFLTVEEEAGLLGHKIDGASKILVNSAQDNSKSVAFGFRTLLDNGYYRYYWLLKGKFIDSEVTYATKGESTEFQDNEMKGAFAKVNKYYTVDGEQVQPWMTKIDCTNESSRALGDKWFEQVVVPGTTTV